MTTNTEPCAGELVPLDQPPAPMTLFGTSDARVALARMADIATALVDVIDKRHLFARINGRKHITAEGWTTLGAMLGVVPVVTGTRPNETGDGIVATVEARTLDGRVVGAAESECSRAESKWKNRDPYALRSMAQTRAISRALRGPLGMIVVLAGYEASAAEEMPGDRAGVTTTTIQAVPAKPFDDRPADEQKAKLTDMLAELTRVDPATDWKEVARQMLGVPWDQVTSGMVGRLIAELEDRLAEKAT